MRVLDLDMDYFMKSVATFINESHHFLVRKDLLKRIMEIQYGLQKKFDNS